MKINKSEDGRAKVCLKTKGLVIINMNTAYNKTMNIV